MGRILGILVVVVQLYFMYDAYQKRKFFWIFVILFAPGLGSIIYFFIEKYPELKDKGITDKAGESLESFFYPDKEIQKLEEAVELSPSFKNRMALADGYQRARRYEDALEIYTALSKGPNKQDPNIWKGIAYAQFQLKNVDKVPAAVERMREFRSGNKPSEFDLLLPEALEQMGNLAAAEIEYSALAETFSGEQARCRYAQFLQSQGKEDQAREIYNEMLLYAKTSPQYYKQSQKEWLNIARRELKVLN
ncbi:MAG: PLDc N-terminal domain-containing protein [Bacteroidota bacterium]